MNKIEKIKAAIAGERIASIPFSFWTHLPEVDREPAAIAQATYDFYRKYDLDFIKTMNNGMYAVEDYGTEIDFSEVAQGGVAKVVSTPIQTYQDWGKIGELAIDEGALARELDHLERLLDLVAGEAPVIFTVFSPLTTADKLAAGRLVDYMAEDEQGLIEQALANIAKTTAKLAERALALGAAGVYFASQMSTYDKMSGAAYQKYGVPFDLQVLDGAREGWFNTIHAHGNNIMFDLLKDYPVAVFNWHAWETLPEIKEGIDFTRKCVLGGIARMDITHNNYNALRNQIYRTIMASGGRHLILSPGCGIRHPFEDETIAFLKKVKMESEAILNNAL